MTATHSKTSGTSSYDTTTQVFYTIKERYQSLQSQYNKLSDEVESDEVNLRALRERVNPYRGVVCYVED